ncbi:hypothetical protein TGAM01_v202261 [Trichoderma gamsii]|uniref:Uncharacterized protein n=1 Tax=Trichoderma gamsii TaxID=398673 RepID=A0A2P4ZY24_9HYPO|nr:hypothetical protein TGAM01_v202261 [Trichoderma gamsii]PON29153.1 hypothetical protein TGAM01_v202261 [Trichoderma gamsii]
MGFLIVSALCPLPFAPLLSLLYSIPSPLSSTHKRWDMIRLCCLQAK